MTVRHLNPTTNSSYYLERGVLALTHIPPRLACAGRGIPITRGGAR
jgi:hypothetical protein